jgi:hypothetical protein
MSTPEHSHHSDHPAAAGEVEVRAARDAAIYANATNPTRTTRVISWAGWHFMELAGVSVPLVLAATTWDGFYAASGLAVLAWAAHEVRLHRQKQARRAARATTNPNGTQGHKEVVSDEQA